MMWTKIRGKPCESIVLVVSSVTFINSFVHFILSCVYLNFHCLPFALFSTLLSAFVIFIYLMSLRDLIDKHVKRVYLTVTMVITVFLMVMIVFFIVAYFSLCIRFMRDKSYNFRDVETKYNDEDLKTVQRKNYWPVLTCLWMILLELCLLVDIARRQCYRLPKNPNIQMIDRNASIISYYDN